MDSGFYRRRARRGLIVLFFFFHNLFCFVKKSLYICRVINQNNLKQSKMTTSNTIKISKLILELADNKKVNRKNLEREIYQIVKNLNNDYANNIVDDLLKTYNVGC